MNLILFINWNWFSTKRLDICYPPLKSCGKAIVDFFHLFLERIKKKFCGLPATYRCLPWQSEMWKCLAGLVCGLVWSGLVWSGCLAVQDAQTNSIVLHTHLTSIETLAVSWHFSPMFSIHPVMNNYFIFFQSTSCKHYEK